MTFEHVMIDIETFDTTLDSVIVAIAAVKFSMEHDDIETFYQNVDAESCSKIGMTISHDTLDWWRKRDAAARNAILPDRVDIGVALSRLSDFIGKMPKSTEFWAHGVVFDYGNLENAYRRVKQPCPWVYYQISDTRTIFRAAAFDFKTIERVGTYHNAKDDCLTQIKGLKEALA